MSDGFAFSVYSAKAAKFENATTQVKYVHLNLRLDSGIPAGASGVVPELTGVVSMASSTKAMLKDQQTSQDVLVGAQKAKRRVQRAFNPTPALALTLTLAPIVAPTLDPQPQPQS